MELEFKKKKKKGKREKYVLFKSTFSEDTKRAQ